MSGGGFDLSNYKTVPERIAEAKAAYPEGRFQTELLVLPAALADKYIAVKARFFRTADDQTPGEGIAWEVVPGKTPYTKDSELQNCETSAWGRALVAAFAVDASKGIASREEVQSRQSEPKQRPRSGPQQRTPRQSSTRDTESTPTPPKSDQASSATEPSKDAPDLELVRWVAKQKLWLVDQLGGDKDRAKAIWAEVLATYDLGPDQLPLKDSLQFIQSDLSIALGRFEEIVGQEALLDPDEAAV